MDLYSSDVGAIQEGNMRAKGVMDANQKIKTHNDDLAGQIAGLRSQNQTSDVLEATKDATSQFWATGKVPSQVKAFQSHLDKGGTLFSNPTTQAQQTSGGADVGEVGETGSASRDIGDLEDVGDDVFESGEGEGLASKIGSKIGTLGSVGVAGLDIYKDIESLKAGKGIAGDNWASKTSNLLQIGGAIADVGGTVFPPAALLGGAVDLVGGAFGEIGDFLDSGKQDKAADQLKTQETEAPIVAQTTDPASTGRVS